MRWWPWSPVDHDRYGRGRAQRPEGWQHPIDGLVFDVEHNDFWHHDWPSRPHQADDANATARTQLATVPVLIPIHRHRYLPSEPCERGIPRQDVERFRTVVEVLDAIGERDRDAVIAQANACAARKPGAVTSASGTWLTPTPGSVHARMTPDPAGYFVIYPDPAHRRLDLEHYTTDGVLDGVIEGPTAAHCYTAAIEEGMLTTLDHAAYLGRELARAEATFATGGVYVQDAVPEMATSVGPTCQTAGCRSCHPESPATTRRDLGRAEEPADRRAVAQSR